jgi:hypothetical protein
MNWVVVGTIIIIGIISFIVLKKKEG